MSKLIRFKVTNRKFSSLFNKDVWTSNNVVKSPCKDIVIPKLTIDDYIWRNLDKWPKKLATVCGITNRSYTFEQLHKQSKVLAANLRKKFNINNGDTVAVIMRNCPEYPAVILGVISAGAIVSTMNPVYTAHELQRLITLSEAKLLIADPDIVPTLKTALEFCKKDIPIIAADIISPKPENTVSYKEIIEDKHVDLDILNSVRKNPEDTILLPYSSGTTGLPKAVQLSHRNIVANCEQQNTELRQHRLTTASEQDSTLVILPMFHSYGLGILSMHKLSAGLKLVTLPKFEPNLFLETILKYQFDLLYLAPPMVLFLAMHPNVTPDHFNNLRTIICGGAPLPPSDIEKCSDKIKKEVQFSQGYGMTEASPLVTITPQGDKRYESVGFAIPNIELRIVDGNMNNLGPDEVGELLIRGPNIMKGYKNNPEANSEVFLEGHWYRSGDLAKIGKDGLVTISDRLKELIKVNAFQVPPAELEYVLKEHPDVLDAGVIGIPDPKSGERPKAFVVLKENSKTTEEQLMQFVSNRVAPYKKIKELVFVESLPKNPTGKILRKVLKEKYC